MEQRPANLVGGESGRCGEAYQEQSTHAFILGSPQASVEPLRIGASCGESWLPRSWCLSLRSRCSSG